MNKGIELLLKRMKSHPEEFAPVYGSYEYEEAPSRWHAIINPILRLASAQDLNAKRKEHPMYAFITADEMKAVHTAYVTACGEGFSQEVMRLLLEGDKPETVATLSASTTVFDVHTTPSLSTLASSTLSGGLKGPIR